MKRFFGKGGAHRAAISVRTKIGASVAAFVLACTGGVLVAGNASAAQNSPHVGVNGYVTCPQGRNPLNIAYYGNTGDRGIVPVQNGKFFTWMTNVAPNGEWFNATINCRNGVYKSSGFWVGRPQGWNQYGWTVWA